MATEDNITSGLSPAEAARQARLDFGAMEATKEAYRDQRGLPRLESIAADVVFGWRQLRKHPGASVAAILSLALAIGATTAAFRLVDAVLLRQLPVAQPERLFFVANTFVDREKRRDYREYFDYPTYREYRDLVKDRADLMVVGGAVRRDATIEGSDETEKVYREYFSGNVFSVFGLQPALGRLLAPTDDLKPGAHPVAVLSHDFWTPRFAGNSGVIGKTIRIDTSLFEIVGVAPKGFFGTSPGEVTDVFVPAMMNSQAINSPGWAWFRIWVRPRAGVYPEQVRQPLQALFARQQKEQLRNFHSDTPQGVIQAFLKENLLLLPAGGGVSVLRKDYRRPLLILTVLVSLVLLVACVNLANLMMAQAATRAREMALRVSIGAGRWRLVRLVLIQSALLALGASVPVGLFAAWAAPLVTSLLRLPGDPVRLVLDTGWRGLLFSAALALTVTLLFGLAPALRASAVEPLRAIRGGDDSHSRRRLMNTLLAAQLAFCVVVLFVAGLFFGTFQRLAHRPIGFSSERVLILEVSAAQQQPAAVWMQVADECGTSLVFRQFPGRPGRFSPETSGPEASGSGEDQLSRARPTFLK